MSQYRQYDVAYVFNPTKEALSVKWDGEDYYVAPGYTAMPAFLAQKTVDEQHKLDVKFVEIHEVVVSGKLPEPKASKEPKVEDAVVSDEPKKRAGRPAKKEVSE